MQYSTILASVLAAAATVTAASIPADTSAGDTVATDSADSGKPGSDRSKILTLTLRTGETELDPIALHDPRPSVAKLVRSGGEPITEVELAVGDDVQNPDVRCQIQDEHHQPIVVLRGNNTDVTLADGGGGPWTLREPTVVDQVVCRQDFEKIDPEDERLQVSVLIQSQNPEVGINFDLSGVLRDDVEVREPTAIETVTLDVSGELVDPALRCQLVGENGPITVLRGENVKKTFADGDGGPWTLQEETVVKQIICDPEFQNQE